MLLPTLSILLEPIADGPDNCIIYSYVMGIGEAEAFSERLKRELQALEAANVHAILENEPLIHEVVFFSFVCWTFSAYRLFILFFYFV